MEWISVFGYKCTISVPRLKEPHSEPRVWVEYKAVSYISDRYNFGRLAHRDRSTASTVVNGEVFIYIVGCE